MSFSDVLLMMFSAILVENFIFSRFYGCCPFLGVSEKPDTALGMGMAVTFIEMFLRRFIPALYGALGIYLPLITTNCAVLSSALLIVQEDYTFPQAVVFGFSAALGFTLAITVFAGVRARMEHADPPRAFKGFPLTLIAAGLLAMAFSCFSGVRL